MQPVSRPSTASFRTPRTSAGNQYRSHRPERPGPTPSKEGSRVPWSAALDRPVLHAFVRELVDNEKLAAFADALPERARVSESALPIVLASLHERLEQPLVCLVPEDADARDTAEAVAWFLGDDLVGTLPSRGVTWKSGLEPTPHLVGERARALHVLDQGGIVIASARGIAELSPPLAAR